MRIAEVTPVFHPYNGGIGTVTLQNALQFREAGNDVVVYTPLYSTPDKATRSFPFHIERVRPVIQCGNAAFIPSLFLKLFRCDRIHLHYPFIGGAEIVLLAKIVFCKKLLVTYHMDLIGTGARAFFFRVYSFFMVPFIVFFADTIFVTSTDYARHSRLAKFLKFCKGKIIELPIGVDTRSFFPRRDHHDAIRSQYRIGQNEKIILFVGSIDSAHYFKGITVLFDALKDLMENKTMPSVRALIVGDGDLRGSYERYAYESGIYERVIFVGRVAQEELLLYFQSADIFVLPSTDSSEAFGIVLLEAMACGVPVIATDLPGVRSVVRNGENGLLIARRDNSALAAALQDLLTDDEKRANYGIRSREIVEERYSYQAVAEKLVSYL